MGVEGGPSGGSAGSGGIAISAGPSIGVGSLESFGAKMTAPFSAPVSKGFVSGNRFNVGIDFKIPESAIKPGFVQEANPLNAADVISQAELILSQSRPHPVGEVEALPGSHSLREALSKTGGASLREEIREPAATEVPSIFQSGLADINLDPGIKSFVAELELSEPSPQIAFVEPAISPLPEIRTIIVPQINPGIASQDEYIPHPVIQPAVRSGVGIFQAATNPQMESRVSQRIQPGSDTRAQEQVIEELVKEEVAVAAKEDAQLQGKEEDVMEEIKLQRVVDESAIKQRVKEIIEAATKVTRFSNNGSINGRKIVENLPGQHPKNRSGELNIVDPAGKLLDGSLTATFKELALEKFTSVLDVIKRVTKIVTKNIPVTRGKGQPVTDADVAKVYDQYKGKVPLAQEVIRRIVKMQKRIKIIKANHKPNEIISLQEKIEEKTEGTIQDHPEFAQALKAA